MSDIDNHDQEMEESFITLIGEDGEEEEFEVIEILHFEGKEYVVIAPLTDDEDDEALVYRLEYNQESGEELLVDIEDDDEWDRVVDYYMGFEEEEE